MHSYCFWVFIGLNGIICTIIASENLPDQDESLSKELNVLQELVPGSLAAFYQNDLSESGKSFFLLFSKICKAFAKDKSSLVSSSDFAKIKRFYTTNSLEFMKILEAFGDRKMVIIICLILKNKSVHELNIAGEIRFSFHKPLYYGNICSIFYDFNGLILTLLEKPFPNLDIVEKGKNLKDRVETLRTMLQILQEINYSHVKFCFSLTMRKISTESYIRIMTAVIERIEADFLVGATVINFQLRQLTKKHSLEFPTEEPLQRKILSLLILWRYYSIHIFRFESSCFSVDNLDPIFLAQVFLTNEYHLYLEKVFTFFKNPRIISKAISHIVKNNPKGPMASSKRDIGYMLSLFETYPDSKGNSRWIWEVLRKLKRFQYIENLKPNSSIDV
jgi:hypothetical protein